MKIRRTNNKLKSKWNESDQSDQENETPLDVADINTFSYEDVVIMEQGSGGSQSTGHLQPSDDRNILYNMNEFERNRPPSRAKNLLFNGKYFTLKSKTPINAVAKCMCCGNNVKGYGSCSSNFITHFRTVSVEMIIKLEKIHPIHLLFGSVVVSFGFSVA